MSYAVCRMQKVKSAGLKGMQFHNQRERKVERMMILTMSEHVKIMI
ncbi:plasmid recombination enzyme family protein (plasmid) [Staphylococcus aureus]|nr:plasmid recombination enzyme family protein [Staphylococcus aureus]